MWKRCSSDSMVNHDEIAMRHLVSLACKCCSVFISEDLGCDALLDIVNMLRSSLRSSSIPRKTSSIPALMCLIEVYDANYINEILTSSQSKILQKKDQKVNYQIQKN
ncbi:uncharacterized protein LOC113388164 [Ctenocephalides felis]|uniref:uncharacterized protein LOC113388164 n=1 Tax=Ctenocephalides felis TaxID=7515 RepID=UPI000E6E1D75|nr:uncharacterized protein LOC113388164 [Ctenocephalides felis]